MGPTFNFASSAVTSLVGSKACTDACSGSVSTFTGTNGAVSTTTGTANYCGGAKQFNLYALATSVAFPTTGGPMVTSTLK
jgi:iron transport multicopper oxidase